MEKIKVKRIFLANAIEVAGAGCTALYPNIPRFFNHYPDWAVLQDLSTKCLYYARAEAQKPGWQGGIAIRKFFARPGSFCA